MEMSIIFSVLVACQLVCGTVQLARGHDNNDVLLQYGYSKIDINYKTHYFEEQVDHFGYANSDTFKLRYLLADQHWAGDGAPIFFYTGNEGDITWFCNNTGLMWEWAVEFKALLVFAEHRYYGMSLPYGDKSYKGLQHLGYLTSEQALADFAVLITHLKATLPGAATSPVIAFGGSYGGMLTTWMRMKYPHIVIGGLAASAPVWEFGDLVPCGTFNQIVTKDYEKSGPNCAENIRKSWAAISKMAATATGRQTLAKVLRLCVPLKDLNDIHDLKAWLMNVWTNLAMVDYPYAASFLEPLPAWPITAVCRYLAGSDLEGETLLASIADALNVYFNYTGNTQCFNSSQQSTTSMSDEGWDFQDILDYGLSQACTEMVMPICSDGVRDMFEPAPWNYTSYAASCQEKWGVTPRPDWIQQQYGGKNITFASNIIFSNGLLDPWSAGGVKTTLSDTLVAIVIPEGAHHLDLRGSNPSDPTSVLAARQHEKEIVQGWIEQHRGPKSSCSNDVLHSRRQWLRARDVIISPGAIILSALVVAILITLALLHHSSRRRQPIPQYSADEKALCQDS